MAEEAKLITGDAVELARQLSVELGFTLCSDELDLLADPNILGVQDGSYIIARAQSVDRGTVPWVVKPEIFNACCDEHFV